MTRNKIFTVQHEHRGGMYSDYILLPLGARLNMEARGASVGDTMNFLNGVSVTVSRVLEIPIRDTMTNALCKMKYGHSMGDVWEQWQKNAMFLGNGRNAVDEEKCLIVFYDRV